MRDVPVKGRECYLGLPARAHAETHAESASLHCGKYYANIYGMPTPVEELIQAAADARRIAQKAIELAVREARAADWSWDQISAALGGRPNGETLRRNFGSGE